MGGMGTTIRRLVNIVAERGCSGMYTLHRLDVAKHLFYPSRAAAEAANKTNGKVSILPWLPATVMRFEPSPTTLWDAGRLEMFALVSPRSCEDRILCSNTAGHTTLYNAYSNCVQALPDLNGGKGFMPMAISIARPAAPEEDLYVMNTAADLGDGMCCFEVLRFGSLGGNDSEVEGPMVGLRGWRWGPLPPPPFSANICAHTVVDGGSTICVSASEALVLTPSALTQGSVNGRKPPADGCCHLMAQQSMFLTSSCGWASPVTTSNCVLGTSLPWTNHRHCSIPG
ncbi:unnamed protein product [Urochloa decumbens]|uniref:Uncharacterized protein n=1 Tax=Urochloa decumbens TaxID=240449 RepID=A0ABC9FL56_9POAL